MGVALARIRDHVETGVVRHREDGLDADVPIRIIGAAISEPEIGGLAHELEPLRLIQGALKLDLALLVISGLRQQDGH